MVKNHKVFNFRSLDCGCDAEKKWLVFVSLLNLKWLPEWDDFRTFSVEILEKVGIWPNHLAA